MIAAGCPMNGREWIVKHWVRHIVRAADEAEQDLILVTLISPEDYETNQFLEEACATNDVELLTYFTDEPYRKDKREWNHERYHHMVELRNTLLEYIRLLGPEYFLSVDSDILLDRKVIVNMVEDLESGDFDAVASKCWLSPNSNQIVNWAVKHTNGSLRRSDQHGVFPVDVIMALKLMNHSAYSIDYAWDSHGEDIGWSDAAKAAGLKLGFDGRSASKHCMAPEDLHKVDKRIGW